MRELLRIEKKYLLTYEQFRSLDYKLGQALHLDCYSGKEGYMVRSLYFDTLDDTDYFNKEMGLEHRKKIRLRTYSPEADFALLEMKQKQGENQFKRSLRVSRKDAEELLKSNYSCLMKYEESFAVELYSLMNMMCYRPKAVVEYQRKAYVIEENMTRITLDFQIKATETNYNIFAPDLNQYSVLNPNFAVLEVKYTGFLLDYIKDLISIDGKTQSSVSKYCLGRGVGLHYLF